MTTAAEPVRGAVRARRRRGDRSTGDTFEPKHVVLVASSGGHLAQLVALGPWWRHRGRTWVTFETPDATSRLRGEDVVYAYHPTTRNVRNLIRNFGLAARVLRSHRTELVVSTGAAVAVPFFVLARAFRIRSVYIEVVDRVTSRTMTGKICYRLADAFLVQWPEQRELYPEAEVVGVLL